MHVHGRSVAVRLFVGASVLLFAQSCSRKTTGPVVSPGSPAMSQPIARAVPGGAGASGMKLRVTAGEAPKDAVDRAPVAKDAAPLPEPRAQAIFKRLAAMTAGQGETKSFAFRERSLPAPRAGATVQTPFPPAEEMTPPVKPAPKELTVLRHLPEGDVELAPHLSVTFNQPMIPITSHDDSIAGGVPVRISPAPTGKWRWVGTQTLLFEPEMRFPKATVYEVEVPAGTAAMSGAKLAAAKKWTFTTPPLRLTHKYPEHGPQRRDVLIFVGFDQRIDAAAVASLIAVAGNGRPIAVRQATQAEVDTDEAAKALTKRAIAERFLVLKPAALLDADTTYTVTVPVGTPSKEGPRETTEAQSFSFRTYSPLKISHTNCSEKYPCPPPAALSMSFNNALDEDAFDAKGVTVSPAIADMRVQSQGSSIQIYGKTKGRTEYKVTVPASLRDVYGQTLGSNESRTFYMGSARPRLFSTLPSFAVLDPSGDKSISIYSVNLLELEVLVYAVEPSDWKAYLEWTYQGLRKEIPLDPPGRRVMAKTINPKGEKDEMVETRIDLKETLEGGFGQRVVLVRQKPLPDKTWERQYVVSWVQVTDLGLDAFIDGDGLLGFATQLKDGKAVAGAELKLWPEGTNAKSDASGLASLDLPQAGGTEGRVLTARLGSDLVMLPESEYGWQRSSSWHKRSTGQRAAWFVFDDRKLYKPKEEVRVKGFVRQIDFGKAGVTSGLPPGEHTLKFQVRDARGNEIGKGEAKLTSAGGFDFMFKLPDSANLGTSRVHLTLSPFGQHWHTFQVQEFRRPEFEVGSKASEGPHFVGAHADISATATYFAGGGLPNADTTWRVTSSAGYFVPPKRGEYSFGGAGDGAMPYYFLGHHSGHHGGRGRRWSPPAGPRLDSATFQGKTDGAGTHRIRVHFDAIDPPRSTSVSAQATIVDVNRQSWSTTTNLLVHPAAHYVGLKTDRYFYEQGKPLVVRAIVSDLEGKLVPERTIEMKAVRLEWRYQKREYKEIEADPQPCSIKSGASEPVECKFETKNGGRYRITADIVDDKGRKNRTVLHRWVSGGKMPSRRNVEMEKVEVIADKDKYAPGETAELLIVAPFSPSEGLVTVRRAGLLHKERVSLQGGSTVVRVPILDMHVPSLTVQVDLVGSAARVDDAGKEVVGAPRRPALASGSVTLSVPPEKHKLSIDVKAREAKTEPGAETEITVQVKDAAGQPVASSEVALVVVDEAVLAMTGYRIGGILNAFHPGRGSGVRDYHMRPRVQLVDPLALLKSGAAGAKDNAEREESPKGRSRATAASPMPSPAAPAAAKMALLGGLADAAPGEGRGGGQGQAPIAVRTDFRPLALFAPALVTDSNGVARVPFKLPDNLTRYRMFAVAASGETKFGDGEGTLVARLPLMVRPSAPRFLNFGDVFELPFVVQNQTDAPMKVELALRTSNLTLREGAGRVVTVPANDRVEVRFPAAAAMPGTAGFQIGVASGKWSDAAEGAMPVWTPATTEAFATYGAVDKGAVVQPVQFPKGVVAEFGGLEVTTSSTELQALTDAVLYLVQYPFDCAEQRASRVLAIAALKDVLAAFEAPGLPPPKDIEASVKKDLEKLATMQNSDGGFPFWTRGYPSWPFLSIHVTHALVRAKNKGFAVPAPMLTRAMAHLKDIERYIPADYPESVRRAIRAYSVYVRGVGGDDDLAKAQSLYGEFSRDKEPALESVGWLYAVLSRGKAPEVAAIRTLLKNRVTETAAAAHFATSFGEGAYLLLYSDRRVDAVLLEAIMQDQPDSDLIVKLVRGLLAHRKKGRWGSTQENAWVLLAMDRYFHTYEKVTPDFVARAWLGDKFAGQHTFKGRTTERHLVEIPMSVLAAAKAADLILDKQGAGRMYYRIGMKYAPSDLKPPPAEHGFTVMRRFEAVDDPKEVSRDKDGTWRVKAGARVRTVVTMVAPTRRYHVALVDPLPAGFEAVNAALRGAERLPSGKDPWSVGQTGGPNGIRGRAQPMRWWWNPRWYEHHNLRDERAEAFSSLVWAGVHSFEYVSRATTPGTFVVPPPKAEEMYHPETFGRGAGDKLVVQ